jgi:hypothetical protein
VATARRGKASYFLCNAQKNKLFPCAPFYFAYRAGFPPSTGGARQGGCGDRDRGRAEAYRAMDSLTCIHCRVLELKGSHVDATALVLNIV